MKLNEVKAGDKLVTDAGFTCMGDKQVVEVQKDNGGLFIPCADGHHYLDGQQDDSGNLVGLAPVK